MRWLGAGGPRTRSLSGLEFRSDSSAHGAIGEGALLFFAPPGGVPCAQKGDPCPHGPPLECTREELEQELACFLGSSELEWTLLEVTRAGTSDASARASLGRDTHEEPSGANSTMLARASSAVLTWEARVGSGSLFCAHGTPPGEAKNSCEPYPIAPWPRCLSETQVRPRSEFAAPAPKPPHDVDRGSKPMATARRRGNPGPHGPPRVGTLGACSGEQEPSSSRPMIRLDSICKQHGRQILFLDASMSLFRGEKVGLVGPNGSGKSTIFRLIVKEEQAGRRDRGGR